jgi:hypothetical protein
MATQNSSNDVEIPDNLLTAKGDIVTATGNGVPARLPVGADGQILMAASEETNGIKWGIKITVANSAPAGPATGDLWIDTT